jgi:hypothetical protein
MTQELVDDLHATQDEIAREVEELSSVEEEKRELAAADPQVDRLSRRARRAGARIAKLTVSEETLAREIREP